MDQNGKYDDMEESIEVEKDIESLVEMLIQEEQSGYYFLNYLHTQQNQVDCLFSSYLCFICIYQRKFCRENLSQFKLIGNNLKSFMSTFNSLRSN